MRKREEEQGTGTLKFMSCMVVCGALALLLCLIILCLLSFLISNGQISDGYMLQYTIASCAVSAFLGGMAAVSRCRSKTLLVGAGTGAVLFLLLLTIGALFYDSASLEHHGTGIFCAALSGGALAGLLGGKSKKKRRK